MALSPRLLGDGEVVVAHVRTHPKALAAPVGVALLVVLGLVAASIYTPASWQPYASWVIAAVGAAVTLIWVLIPVLRWLTTTYTVTNRRIITRRGILTRTGHDLPINRINDVTYTRDLLDRLLGCGTLVLTTAADEPVPLHDVPDVERLHVQVANLLFGSGGPAAPRPRP